MHIDRFFTLSAWVFEQATFRLLAQEHFVFQRGRVMVIVTVSNKVYQYVAMDDIQELSILFSPKLTISGVVSVSWTDRSRLGHTVIWMSAGSSHLFSSKIKHKVWLTMCTHMYLEHHALCIWEHLD
jgi:hypothetical protein